MLTTTSSPPNVATAAATTLAAPVGRRHVGDDPVRATRARRRRDRLGERFLAARAEDDVRSLLDEPCRDAAPDPATRAGDERDLPFEPEIHGASLIRCRRPGSCSPATVRPTGTASGVGKGRPIRRSTTTAAVRRPRWRRNWRKTGSPRSTRATCDGRARPPRRSARASALEVVLDRGLREIDVGSWSGLTRAEVEERFPEGFARWRGGEIGHDGETSEELTERVVETVERIAATHEGQTVVIVTHGGSIRALRRHAAGDPGEVLSNCDTVSMELVEGVLVGSSGLTAAKPALHSPRVEDYTNKYKGEQVELALFGGEYQEGVLTAYCSIEDVPHVELNGHILVPLQNVASLHCSSRCDAPEPDWPPRGLEELDRDDRPDEDDEG